VSIAICHNRQFNEPPEPPLMPLGDALYDAAATVAVMDRR
jgi:hypothetical protein